MRNPEPKGSPTYALYQWMVAEAAKTCAEDYCGRVAGKSGRCPRHR